MTHVVEVEIVEIRPNGVIAKVLDNERLGFIHKRELSWDRRVSANLPTLEIGERAKAALLHDKTKTHYIGLSLRQCTNPWQNAEKEYQVGQVVRGEVVNIRHFGVFVQIEPGIDALIWPRDIPFLRHQLLEEVLAVGDQVQGVITDIDYNKKQMNLSLTKRLQALGQVLIDSNFYQLPQYQIPQLELFKGKLIDSQTKNLVRNTYSSSRNDLLSRRYRLPIPRPEMFLVVDDDPDDLEQICQGLQEELKVEVEGVHNRQSVLEKIAQGNEFDLAVIDLTLEHENGTKVAEALLDLKPDLSIIFVSHNPLMEQKINIRGRSYPFSLKEAAQIVEWVDKLCSGYWEDVAESNTIAYAGRGNYIRQLGMVNLAHRSLAEALSEILFKLRKETKASYVMVLEVDSANKAVSIMAVDPPLMPEVQLFSLDNLYYSPVRNVVENEEMFYKIHIDQDNEADLKYFFPLLTFQSCLGIPLTIPNFVTRHALFLLDEYKPILDQEAQEKAQLATQAIQVALERAILLDYMQRYEQRYHFGELLGSLVHELSNKLDALGGVETLHAILQKATNTTEEAQRSKLLINAQKTAEKLAQARADLKELIWAYSRMVSNDSEPVNVNVVLRKVKLQLETKARETKVQIILKETPDLPLAKAIQSRLEQVVANLILNAIQQIEKQRHLMTQIAQQRNDNRLLLPGGVVVVQTRYKQSESSYPIEIIVTDTGPGIHHYRQEKIFLMDTSTRSEGQGLGLFISRNLVEAMGGRLRLIDSVMFIGSVFMVELPRF